MKIPKAQICTYGEYNFSRKRDAFAAFKNMGRGAEIFGKPAGLVFAKLMGTGSGNGFSILPNLKSYAIFMVWESMDAAALYHKKNETIRWYKSTSHQSAEFWLKPLKSHGMWSGQNPFIPSEPDSKNAMLAVLTRATIHTRHLPEFWWNVPDVSSFMSGADGLLYRLGVGEYPLMMQATFSVWENREKLMKAAYGNTAHAEIVKRTRERGWYSEEMFTQFEVIGCETKGDQFTSLATSIPAGNPGSPN